MEKKGISFLGIGLGIVIGVLLVAVLVLAFLLLQREARITAIPVTETAAATAASTAAVSVGNTVTATFTITPTHTNPAASTPTTAPSSAPTELVQVAQSTPPLAATKTPVYAKGFTFRPSAAQIGSLPWIWDEVPKEQQKNTIPEKPGRYSFDIVMKADQKYRFGSFWCSSPGHPLEDVIEPLTMSLRINGLPVDPQDIYEYEGFSPYNWECHYWYTGILDRAAGETMKLELRYSLSRTIFDGKDYVEQGDYQLVLNATAQ